MRWIVLLFLILSFDESKAQCSSFISTFPYFEDFEVAPAWTPGGINSDWAWGAPSHPLISSAGGGTKCWCVGGLTGTYYNYSELSWLLSPCFDFTTLKYPWISFKIFWETEWKWDGVVLQYSLDSGYTWGNVGVYGDATNCLNDHWFNSSNIGGLTSIASKQGWAGRLGTSSGSCQGGNGSGVWVTAKHCLNGLTGLSNVRFRFLFGAGSTCNDYDGIAIDDILIEETPPNVANFSYVCSNNYQATFTNLSLPCPSNFFWDFGDVNSGAFNTSLLENPTHTFSTAGTFNVTLKVSGPCNAPDSISIPVTVFSVNTMATNIACSGSNNGSILSNVTGGSSLTYIWSPGGQSTPNITGLSVGTYVLSVTSANSCTIKTTITITEPPTLIVNLSSSNICSGQTTSLNLNLTGGTPAYSFLWNTNQITNPISVTPASTSIYQATVTDNNGCSDTTSSTVFVSPLPSIVAGPDTNIVVGSSVTLTVNGSGSSYLWSPSTELSCDTCSITVATPPQTTNYIVITQNAFGCENRATVTIEVKDDLTLYVPNAFIPKHGNLYAYGIGIRDFEFYIFNRWGELVFQTKDPLIGWDGLFKQQLIQDDAYVYLARGVSFTGISITKTGTIMLLK